MQVRMLCAAPKISLQPLTLECPAGRDLGGDCCCQLLLISNFTPHLPPSSASGCEKKQRRARALCFQQSWDRLFALIDAYPNLGK